MKNYLSLVILLSLAGFSRTQIIINEFSCSNVTGPTDAFGQREDWIELYKKLLFWELQLEDINDQSM